MGLMVVGGLQEGWFDMTKVGCRALVLLNVPCCDFIFGVHYHGQKKKITSAPWTCNEIVCFS